MLMLLSKQASGRSMRPTWYPRALRWLPLA